MIENVIQCTISDSGMLAYVPGTTVAAAIPQRTLVWVDRNGKEEPLAVPPGYYGYPEISPDGTRIALTHSKDDVHYNIWVWDIVRKTMTRVTFAEKVEVQAIWSPDGKRIVFASGYLGNNDVCRKAADVTGEVEKLGSHLNRSLLPWSFPRDGKCIVIAAGNKGLRFSIGMISMEGDHAQRMLLSHEKYDEAQPEISPDGQWIAYASNESTGVMLKTEVYVRPFPDVDKGKWQISTGGGNSPLWSPDGRELFYLSDDNSAMSVAMETKPALRFGTPKILFRGTYVGTMPNNGTPWDITPDGHRFLMMKEAVSAYTPTAAVDQRAAEAPRKINLVLNWFEELKRQVP